MTAGAGEVAQQLAQGRFLAAHQADDHLGAAAGGFDQSGIGEVLGRQGLVQWQVGEVVAAETAGQALASDFGIAEVVQLAGGAQRLGLGGADHRAETWQDQDVVR